MTLIYVTLAFIAGSWFGFAVCAAMVAGRLADDQAQTFIERREP